MRLLEINGRWIASADTPDGPSLGSFEDYFAHGDLSALDPLCDALAE